MNTHLQKIIFYVRGIKTQATAWFKELPRTKQLAVVLLAVLILLVGSRAFKKNASVAEVEKVNRIVTLARVTDLTNKDADLPLLGTVTSVSEATIRAESSGKLNRVYKKLGDSVVAGQVIAEFENSAERAALLQAEGAYDSAKAARDIARINSGTTNSSLSDVKTATINTLSSAYTTMDDVIHVKTDTAYSNPRDSEATFLPTVPDQSLVNTLEAKRKIIEGILTNREARNKTLTQTSDLTAEITTALTEVQTLKKYFDDLATAYNKALPDAQFTQTMLDSGKANIGAARVAISGTITALNAARTTLTASIAAQEISGKTVTPGDSSTATADAAVKSALGVYNAALSRLEKTVIRSPINGTLNSLSIETGDFITAFTEVAVVSNNGALEVLSYVTDEDARRIAVGNEVSIDSVIKGIITRKAQAIDPKTKKIEVRIGITDAKTTLVNGQSVRISISKTKETSSSLSLASGPIKIPLSALKLTPQGAFVFILDASSTLVALPVKEGALLGEDVQVLSGLTGSEEIVVDARGLKAGTTVTVESK